GAERAVELIIALLGAKVRKQSTAEARDHSRVLSQLAARLLTRETPRQRHHAQHLGMLDQRLEQPRLRGNRQLQHDPLVDPVEVLQNLLEQHAVGGIALGAFDVHLGLDDRHQPVRQHRAGDVELLGHHGRDARPVGEVDHRPFLGPEHAELFRPLEKAGELRHRLHQLDAVRFLFQPLVDLDERHHAPVDQRLRCELAADLPVHRPLEQDRADHLAGAEARRADDSAAHLVDQAEHFLVVRPRALLDPVALERLGRGPARLVERGDEPIALLDFPHHVRLVHAHPCCSNAATPGSVRPSIHSRNAPPAVETNENSSATPAWFKAATVSPPPATDTSEPSLVSAAAVFASPTVAWSNGSVSNAPRGPFHTSVRQVLRTSASASTAVGPTSRIISSAATSWTLTVRTPGGLAANSFATTTS